ncbi:hypothetical protein SBV1_350008 [Verrucomicrobia bacterium]|nr:hypothetical protein SBV1_350008 [Verrucomicrobiota bacterium]
MKNAQCPMFLPRTLSGLNETSSPGARLSDPPRKARARTSRLATNQKRKAGAQPPGLSS